MRARSGTSQDAKRAREALMKELAALPVSDKARARDAQRKAEALKTGAGRADAAKPDAIKPEAVKQGAIRTRAVRLAPIAQAAGVVGVKG